MSYATTTPVRTVPLEAPLSGTGKVGYTVDPVTGAEIPTYGGCLPLPVGGLGAFDADAVWEASQAGDDAAVRAIQEGLNKLGYGPLVVDSVFGDQTKTAWQRFLIAEGVSPDGKLTVATNKAGIYRMGERLGTTTSDVAMGLGVLAAVAGVLWYASRRKK